MEGELHKSQQLHRGSSTYVHIQVNTYMNRTCKLSLHTLVCIYIHVHGPIGQVYGVEVKDE